MHAASLGGANHSFCCLFMCLPVGRVTEATTCSALSGSRLGLGPGELTDVGLKTQL